jgi:hypothetical protein
MKRPRCPAVHVEENLRLGCRRSRWHRGMHRSGVVPTGPGETVRVHWARDPWAALVRWAPAIRIAEMEPIEWGKR